jgi:hypothetical protein
MLGHVKNGITPVLTSPARRRVDFRRNAPLPGRVAATGRHAHAPAREVEAPRERHRQETLERVKAAFRTRTRGGPDDSGSIS